MVERERDRARSPADVGPTDARLTSGIADDPDPDASPRTATEDADIGPATPAWAASARTVLAAIFLVAFGTFLTVPLRPDAGLGWVLVVLGAGLALWGFATWPRVGNVS